jgi:hypothetical protein
VVVLWMRWFPELVEREEMVAQEAA